MYTVFHVDNMKISCVDSEVVTDIIKKLSIKYGTTMLLTISRGKVHDILGIIFDYSTAEK